MNNTLKINFLWEKRELVLSVETYAANDQIAIMLYDDKTKEYFADLSVYVVPFEDKTYMAVDINNFPNGEELIKEYNLGELVDYTHSWFVSYPIYKMDLDELREYDELWVKEFEKILDNKDSIEEERTVWDSLK